MILPGVLMFNKRSHIVSLGACEHTLSTVTDAPEDLELTNSGKTKVTLQWKVPDVPPGNVIKYKVKLTAREIVGLFYLLSLSAVTLLVTATFRPPITTLSLLVGGIKLLYWVVFV